MCTGLLSVGAVWFIINMGWWQCVLVEVACSCWDRLLAEGQADDDHMVCLLAYKCLGAEGVEVHEFSLEALLTLHSSHNSG
jgi:hypothetical protein